MPKATQRCERSEEVFLGYLNFKNFLKHYNILKELLELYRHRRGIEDLQYLVEKGALKQIASEQRTETVEKSSTSLRAKIGKWLHPDIEKGE